ncbi:MAG: ABC transporter permease [Vicinamibacterales bacterium]
MAVRMMESMDGVLRDIRHSVRGLRRGPGFALAVLLTLALGIGGNTAIFSVVDQVLLRPLPYPDGDRIVRIYESRLDRPATSASPTRFSNGVSPANWLDWQQQSRTISSMGIWFDVARTLTGLGEPERLNGQYVSWEFFKVLGVEPMLGRVVTAEDDRPNAPGVAVLSHSLWQRRFNGESNVIGRVVQLDDAPVTVIGVMPPGFRFIYQDTDFWGAFALDRTLPWREVAGRFTDVIARVAPDATLSSADSEMKAITSSLAARYDFNKNRSVTLVPLREELTGQVERSLIVLYGAVAVLLAIACFNVANLLLARAAARRHEIAIRTSLGAGRLPIVRQLLVESILLALGGGLLGLVVARWSIDGLLSLAPAGLLRVSEVHLDWRVMLYALALSLATGIVVGLMPSFSVARRSLVIHLRESGRNVTHSARLRQGLVVAQVAMTIVLLCAAGLLVRTVIALNSAQSGLDRSNLMTMAVALPDTRYAPPRIAEFFARVLGDLRSMPGVESAGAGNSLPVVGGPRGGTGFHRLGTPMPATPGDLPSATIRVVTSGYFRTLRIPILRGREFDSSDEAPEAASGFIVNDAFVRQHLREVDPLSTSISVRMQRENPYRQIIGVVGDVPEGSIRGQVRPTVFYRQQQMPQRVMSLLIRAPQPAAISRRAVEVLHQVDPNLAVTAVMTMETAMGESIARERLNALVSATFAVSGLLLAALGLYGLLSYFVTERTKEIGIRISLGAPLGRLTGSIVAGGFRLVAIGAVVGIGSSMLLARWLESLLFGVEPYDLPTYATVLALLSAVTAIASWVPARRAAGVEPLAALRQE